MKYKTFVVHKNSKVHEYPTYKQKKRSLDMAKGQFLNELVKTVTVVEEPTLTTYQFHRCFFCEKNPVEFINEVGPVALGERADGSEFGSHPHCGCLNEKATSPEVA